jgi:uncharacterized protein (TIGR02996 family)
MQRPEYWQWIRSLWQNPTDAHRRLVFADWLDEHAMPSAARRQRRFADLVHRALEVIYIPRVEQVYFRLGKTGPYFRIKKDGQVYPLAADYASWNFAMTKHTLKGG